MTENPDKREARFYRDDSSEINPELVSKPSLCVTCKSDNNAEEEILCILTRDDQRDEEVFICDAYEQIKKL